MAGPEFVYLNDQAVRVTSLRRDEATGNLTLVLITRGSADRDLVTKLLKTRPLTLRIPDEGEHRVVTTNVEMHSAGEAQRAMYRFAITLAPEDAGQETPTAPALSIDDRLTSLEQRMDQIVAMLDEIRSGRR